MAREEEEREGGGGDGGGAEGGGKTRGENEGGDGVDGRVGSWVRAREKEARVLELKMVEAVGQTAKEQRRL